PQNTRKPPREVDHPANHIPTKQPRKRLRSLLPGPEQTVCQEAASEPSVSQSYISHWAEKKAWPKEFFEEDHMHRLLAQKRSTASLRRKRSEASIVTSATPSDQRPREEKSAPYKNPSYRTLLEE